MERHEDAVFALSARARNVISIEPEGYCDLKRIVRNVGVIEIAVSEAARAAAVGKIIKIFYLELPARAQLS